MTRIGRMETRSAPTSAAFREVNCTRILRASAYWRRAYGRTSHVRTEEGNMPRAIVYDDPKVQAHYAALVAEAVAPSIREKRRLRHQAEARVAHPPPEGAPDPADLPTKDDY